MNDHSPHFNHVFMRRSFSANVMKPLLFHAKKAKINKMQQNDCPLFFIVLRSKPTYFLFFTEYFKGQMLGVWCFSLNTAPPVLNMHQEFQVQE